MKNITRKGFLISSSAMLATGSVNAAAGKAKTKLGEYVPLIAHDAPPRNRNPYAGVDWSKAKLATTTSHGHCTDQKMLDQYIKHKFDLLTISNYYPSAPRYPGKNFTRDYYIHHADFPVMVGGVRTEGPFDWNKIIAKWKDELDPEVRKRLPFDPKKDVKMFTNWPDGMLEAPNGEHHYFLDDNGKNRSDRLNPNLHMCAPGSFFKSGTFDARNRFKTAWGKGCYCYGCGEHWRTSIDRMIKEMMFPDGGGVTINHPHWSCLNRELILDILDHDSRVLGIEVLEGGHNSEDYWDWVLSTGRQCFGLFVPDWNVGNRDFGANILVVPELTVHECLKAYRQGNFYGSKHAMDELRFTNISFDGVTVRASTDKTSKFQVITARGVVYETVGKSVEWKIPVPQSTVCPSGIGPSREMFVRIKAFATDGSDEELFTQPFMLV